MKTLPRSLCLLSLLLVLGGCGRIESRSQERTAGVTVTREWPAAGIRELRVTEVDGSITIAAAETDKISLVASGRGRLNVRQGAENSGIFETELDGDTLRIGRRDSSRRKSWDIPNLFGRRRGRIDYVLQVPPSVSLSVRTVNGKIVTKGSDSESDFVTVNGSIDTQISGNHELRATTVNGRVLATFSESFQGARFKTVNGRVRAVLPESASFTVNLSQVNGDFEASFPLSIRSSPGSRRVSGDVNGGNHELRIVTVNGNVELARLTDSR
ncbi:MAG TPA: DUF4097 family beta strand repeat-containing protein [Thermoanaerobaculia bacterium]